MVDSLSRTSARSSADWLLVRHGAGLRWGGDLRRHYLFGPLQRLTGGAPVRGWSADAIRAALALTTASRPRLASPEMLDAEALELAVQATKPVVVDLHDEPVHHHEALAIPLEPARADELRRGFEANLETFRLHIAQSPEFARLAGLEPRRTIFASSGSDTARVRPGPWPPGPVVGMTSGASPGRGIEGLIAAVGLLRAERPGTRLWLALVGTGSASDDYLRGLARDVAEVPWITIAQVPYDQLGAALAQTTVLVVPHPPSPYWDAVLPIKLFDYLAAGRPIVATPRAATAALIERHRAGLVARGEAPADLAAAIAELLADPARARRMGAAAREAAVRNYDWRVIGRRLAVDVLRREQPLRLVSGSLRLAAARVAPR